MLQIPANRVICRTKRIGGGFGGKESRSAFLSAALAIAAVKFKRPIRSMLDRDEDIVSSGQRHPFVGKYKVGFNNDGEIICLDLEVAFTFYSLVVFQWRIFIRFIIVSAGKSYLPFR